MSAIFSNLRFSKLCLPSTQCAIRQIHQGLAKLQLKKWSDYPEHQKVDNAYGLIAQKPDYSFVDGRPTPLGSNQKKRIQVQRQTAERIVKLVSEINEAKNNYALKQKEAVEMKARALEQTLKQKGHLLLKK